jgi:FtsH-binding integral membrane protein
MNEKNNIDELEQMRQEFADFKTMLKQQQILNDKMIRRTVQKDYTKERKSIWLIGTMSLFAILAFVESTFVMNVLPVWFFVLTMVYLAFCVAFTVYSVRRYVSGDIITGSVVQAAENMLVYKRLNNRWMMYLGIPSIVVWVALFFLAVSRNGSDSAHGMMLGGVIGLVIGSVCGISYYLDQRRRVDRIIQQIEELKGNGAC